MLVSLRHLRDLDVSALHAFTRGVPRVREVDQPFDIVLTSNSGYPLDLNLYQSVKGMRAAEPVVRPGGAATPPTSAGTPR
mgnify:CR=1 FL=1